MLCIHTCIVCGVCVCHLDASNNPPSDIKALYDEDRKTMLHLTKVTHTSVFLNPLQLQSVHLVCQWLRYKSSRRNLQSVKGQSNCAVDHRWVQR